MRPEDNFQNRYRRPTSGVVQGDPGVALEPNSTPAASVGNYDEVNLPPAPSGLATLLHYDKRAIIISGSVVAAILVIGIASLVLTGFRANKQDSSSIDQPANSYNTSALALGNLADAGQLDAISSASKLAINGDLRVGKTITLSGTLAPSAPVAGQFYYDADTNQPYVYNGQAFVSLTEQTGVQSLAGLSGDIGIGGGLTVVGNQLTLSGQVLGDIAAANQPQAVAAGIQTLQAANGIVIAQNNGSATISLPQLLGTGDRPSFASVQLNDALGINFGGSGTNGAAYAANGVLYFDGGKFATAGAATSGLCLVSGPAGPAFGSCSGAAAGVNSLNGINGSLIIDNATADSLTSRVTMNDASTSQKGIAQFTNGDFSVAAGVVALGTVVTKAGNSFNGSGQLVRLDTGGQAAVAGQCLQSTASGVAFAACPGGGSITSGAAQTPGALTKFDTTTNRITNSIASESGTVLTVVGTVTANGFQGNGSTLTNLNAANITSGTLAVANGGTGRTTFTANSILIGNGTGGVNTLLPGTDGSCLMMVAGAPAYTTCSGAGGVSSINSGSGAISLQGANGITVSSAVGGVITITAPTASGGVASLNGLTGALSVANASASAGIITINDASTAQKGIASFDGTNFTVSNGAVNTVQGISTAATPTFGSLSLQSATAQFNGVGANGTTRLSFAPQAGNDTKIISIPNNNGTLVVSATGGLSIDANGVISCSSCLTDGSGGGASGVSSVNSISGAVAIAGANGISVTQSGNTITVTAPSAAVGVSSLNGETGALSVANSTVAGGVITINDASTSQKGIASFSGTDFVVAGGSVTLSANVTRGGNTFNGAGQLVQLDASGFLPALNGSALTSLNAGNIATGTLAVSRGGTGAGSFNTNGVVYGDGSSLGSTSAGTTGQCLVATTGSAPSFQACTGAGGVTSFNGLDGAITLNNTSSIGNAITIDTASTTVLGIASFNGADFGVAGGAVSLNGNVTRAGNTFNGAGQLVQLDGSAFLPALNGSLLTNLNADNLATGTVSTARGGTGITSYATGDLLFAANTTTLSRLAAGTSGFCLITGGPGAAPTWGNCDAGSGISGVGTFSTTNTAANGATIVGNNIVFQSASTSAPGMVDIGTQTFAGNKTFTGNTTMAGALTSNGVSLFRNTTNSTAALSVQNAAGTNVFNVDTTNRRIDIGGQRGYTGVIYAAALGFGTVTNTSTEGGDGFIDMASADFNGDGYKDIVAVDGANANTSSRYVIYYMNNGNDTFATLAIVGGGGSPNTVQAGRGVETGDINSDGFTDVLVAGIGSVSYFLGNGNGTFQTKATVTVQSSQYTTDIKMADLNGDSFLDIIATSTNIVSVFLGNGNGTFQTKITITAGVAEPGGLSVGDLNNDGFLDLVTLNTNGNNFATMLGNGNGTFQTAASTVSGANKIKSALYDYTGDGILDLAYTAGTTVTTYPGLGNGLFGTPINYTAGSNASGVAFADFNRDGIIDLTVTARSGNTVGVFLGNGSGGFQTKVDYATPTSPWSVLAEDFNNDGYADLMTGHGSSSTSISYRFNSATPTSGTISAALSVTAVTAGTSGLTVQAASGQSADVFRVQNSSSATLFNVSASGNVGIGAVAALDTSIYKLNVVGGADFTGTLRQAGNNVCDASNNCNYLSATTVDANYVQLQGATPGTAQTGNLNITGTGRFGTALNVRTATDNTAAFNVQDAANTSVFSVNTVNKSISVGAPITYNLSTYVAGSGFAAKVDYAAGDGAYSVATTDTNGDGLADIIVANNIADTVSVLRGNGNGTFQAKVDYAAGDGPATVTTADTNGDGFADIITANVDADTVSVLRGNGNGTFQAKVDYAAGDGPLGMATADTNGDGFTDIITANYSAGTVSVLLGTGTGSFQAKVDYTTGSGPISVAITDTNGDGFADIIVANSSVDTVSVLRGNGNGTFQAKVDYAAGDQPYSVTTTDVNGDGFADIITANRSSNNVSVFRGTGTGTFQAKVDYTTDTGSAPVFVTTADTNSDGFADIIVANNSLNTVSVFRGTGTGTFQAKVDYAAGSNPQSVTTADTNNDGFAEIIVANYLADTVSVLLRNSTLTTTPATSTASITSASVNSSALTLQGLAGQASDYFRVQTSDSTALFTVSKSGKVGIGNVTSLDTSAYKLNVVGGASIAGDVVVTGSVTAQSLFQNGNQVCDTSNNCNLIQNGTTLQNASFNLSGNGAIGGTLTVTGLASVQNLSLGGHLITASGLPTFAAQVAAGTGATVSIAGNDTSGTITVTTGTGATAGEIASIIFAAPYGAAPRVVLSPSDTNAAGVRAFKGTATVNNFMLNFKDAPVDSTVYTFDYFISQ